MAAFIVDRVGRKLSMIIMFVVASILLIPLLTQQIEATTTALLFGARALVSATFIVACIYAPEVHFFDNTTILFSEKLLHHHTNVMQNCR